MTVPLFRCVFGASTTTAGSMAWARVAHSEPFRYVESAARLGKTTSTTSWKSPARTAAYRTDEEGSISASTRSSSGNGCELPIQKIG